MAATDDPATAWNVQLTLEFTLAGTPSLIEFDPASDALCPTGRALRIPVEYQAAGTLGEWWVSSSRSGIALVATAAQLDAISSVAISDDLPQWQAEVDPAMEPIIRSELPASAPQDCELGFSLRPEPDSLLAGAWAEEITQGELAVACGGESYSTFTRWVADSITPLAQ